MRKVRNYYVFFTFRKVVMTMQNKKTEYFPISALREELRLSAGERASRLSRSVSRLTSCDMLPCVEYGDEVKTEYILAQELFYLQHCRTALEKTIDAGAARLRYRWPDGSVTVTRFRKIGPNRVKVAGITRLP